MTEGTTPKRLSCIPCARRKIRCDRTEPCSHCVRKGEFCDFPLPRAKKQAKDPSRPKENHGQSNRTPLDGWPGWGSPPTPASLASGRLESDHGTKRSSDGTPVVYETLHRTQASLVEHNKQPIYVETPVWYAWTEAREAGNEPNNGEKTVHDPPENPETGYHNTILDQRAATDSVSRHQHPPAEEVRALWNVFVSNVHPVVKIFFIWDKVSTIELAATDPTKLSQSQRALCYAMYFIATLSLSDEECKAKLGRSSRSSVLNDFQSALEDALLTAKYASTSDLMILQAFLLYMLAMRNRAKPATSFSLLGIAVRIALRMGLHRDGTALGLPPVQAEERRRTWWQMQHLEIAVSQLVGTIAMSLYADWDTALPASIEDDDLTPDMNTLPAERHGLTSMSHCLWRYHVIAMHRARRSPDQGALWINPISAAASRDVKHVMMEQVRKALAEKFLQFCEPVEPLHIHIQIGVQNSLLAMHRGFLQPVTSTKISEMPQTIREELLGVCIKSMDYYILAQTNPLIAHLRWHTENYFQWPALIYILVEAHHRAATAEAATLWKLINRVSEVYPKLTTAINRPEVYAIARLTLLAWQQRQECLQGQQLEVRKPWCVEQLEQALSVKKSAENADQQNLAVDMESLEDFDFDMIDWSFWEKWLFAGDEQPA